MQTEITQTLLRKIPLLPEAEQKKILERVETFLNNEKTNGADLSSSNEDGEMQNHRRRTQWLKANQERYGGQYIVLDGDRLIGTAKNIILTGEK